MSNRFKALGNFVYENGDRIGCTVEEANVDLAKKLNAYQMRVERLKAEVERLIKAGDALAEAVGDPTIDWPPREAAWNAAKEGKPSV